MTPVVVNECAGWFHTPADDARDVAVLLCPGAGQDYSNGYRPLRVLADSLARAGYPVLRFDYPGTGDAGDDHSETLWAAWRRSVREAANWLRRVSGARRLVLAGLRIGGSLAALEAARRDDVAALVLFEPFVNVRSFVLQLTTESQFRKKPPHGLLPPDDAGGVALGELKFSKHDVADMRAADLGRLTFRTPAPVMIFSQQDGVKLANRLELWRRQEIRLFCAGFEDCKALLRPAQHSGEPEINPTTLLTWLSRELSSGAAQVCTPGPAALNTGCWEERAVRFGADARWAGVLCRPKAASTVAVLICNSGGNPRHGFARFGVFLARRLAEAGVTSFRFDFAGLGDSIHLEAGIDTQSDVFLRDRTPEFRAAIDVLQAQGTRRFVVHGLCSGAFHAVQAARADARISGLAVVNLPWFSLRHEVPGPDSTPRQTVAAFRRRGLSALFMFSAEDAGMKQFERHFGANGSDLDAEPGITVSVSKMFDHEVTERWMQEITARELVRFVREEIAAAADDAA